MTKIFLIFKYFLYERLHGAGVGYGQTPNF